MNYVPSDHDLDAINQYLDDLMSPDQRNLFEARLEAEPGLAALLSRFESAFNLPLDGSDRMVSDRVMQAVKAEATTSAPLIPSLVPPPLESPETSDASTAADVHEAQSPLPRIALWRQALKIAACIAISVTLLYVGQSLSPWDGSPRLQAVEMYAVLVDNGFKAPRSCSPERFPEEMEQAVGVPLAFADGVPGVELLGWSYPDFVGDIVLSEQEIVLMARIDGENVAVIIDHEDQSRRLRGSSQQGLEVHQRRIDGLILYEVSPFKSPRILPLLSSAPSP